MQLLQTTFYYQSSQLEALEFQYCTDYNFVITWQFKYFLELPIKFFKFLLNRFATTVTLIYL